MASLSDQGGLVRAQLCQRPVVIFKYPSTLGPSALIRQMVVRATWNWQELERWTDQGSVWQLLFGVRGKKGTLLQ